MHDQKNYKKVCPVVTKVRFRTTDVTRRNMLCRDTEKNELAVQYLAGELDPELGEDFEVHLLECDRCQAALKTLLLMREDLQARAHEIRSYAPPSRGFLQRGWITIAVVAVLVFVAGFLEIRKFQHMHLSQTAQVPPPQSIHLILPPNMRARMNSVPIEAISKSHALKN